MSTHSYVIHKQAYAHICMQRYKNGFVHALGSCQLDLKDCSVVIGCPTPMIQVIRCDLLCLNFLETKNHIISRALAYAFSGQNRV